MGANEKIYLIEDSMREAQEAYEELTNAGHTVIRHSSNYQDAIDKIPEAFEAGMTVAVVDGNLFHHPEECMDGREIAKNIRELAPDTIIIAFSSSKEEKADYGDIYVGKRPRALAEKVTEIPWGDSK